ncbi:reverse transcriptase domain-containing protein [Tanacetum coccineum]
MSKVEEDLQRIKRKLNKLQTLAILKEGEKQMLCLRQRNETICSVLMVDKEGVQAPVSYVSRPLQGMQICYIPKEKNGASFISHNKIPEDKLQKTQSDGGSAVKKFFGEGEQVLKTPDANKGETYNLNKKLQAKLTPTPKAWRLYLGKEAIEEGSGVGIILVSPDEKMHSYAIHLKFNASGLAMDCEALLAGLVASVSKSMKDLHVFIDSLTLVAQIEGNHTPATEQERKYKE